MRKYLTLAIMVLAILFIAACSNRTVVLDEPKTYEVTPDVHSLDIEINAADFSIVHGNEFSVESNLKDLYVSVQNGVLVIEEKRKVGVTDTDAMLELCIPADAVFDEVKIITGAGRLTAQALSAKNMTMKLGAGQIQFEELNAASAIVLEGGAGEITVAGGTMKNLKLNLGVGAFNLTAVLLGESDLQFGIGESNLTLMGSPDDYILNITKGIGSIQVDGPYNSNGSAENYVMVQGGIGSTNIRFYN